ncbi:hypothetical protein TOPH_09116, partial [Tolypocladium ophioglossoides CBS 100239]
CLPTSIKRLSLKLGSLLRQTSRDLQVLAALEEESLTGIFSRDRCRTQGGELDTQLRSVPVEMQIKQLLSSASNAGEFDEPPRMTNLTCSIPSAPADCELTHLPQYVLTRVKHLQGVLEDPNGKLGVLTDYAQTLEEVSQASLSQEPSISSMLLALTWCIIYLQQATKFQSSGGICDKALADQKEDLADCWDTLQHVLRLSTMALRGNSSFLKIHRQQELDWLWQHRLKLERHLELSVKDRLRPLGEIPVLSEVEQRERKYLAIVKT